MSEFVHHAFGNVLPKPEPSILDNERMSAVKSMQDALRESVEIALAQAKGHLEEFATGKGVSVDELLESSDKIVPIKVDQFTATQRQRDARALTAANKLIRSMADAFMPSAMLALGEIVANPMENASARIAAANAIADRSSLGKAKEKFSPLTTNLSSLSLKEAYDSILAASSEGRISLNEVNMLIRVLDGKTKAIELDEVRRDVEALRAIVAGEAPAEPACPSAH
jgi:hypothetical protein